MSSLDDPRVLLAAERTLLAWMRTGITAIGLGFVVARFGLFLHLMKPGAGADHHLASSAIGIAMTLIGAGLSFLAVRQFRRLVATLKPSEIPPGYTLLLSTGTGYAFSGIGVVLAVYLGLTGFAGAGSWWR